MTESKIEIDEAEVVRGRIKAIMEGGANGSKQKDDSYALVHQLDALFRTDRLFLIDRRTSKYFFFLKKEFTRFSHVPHDQDCQKCNREIKKGDEAFIRNISPRYALCVQCGTP